MSKDEIIELLKSYKENQSKKDLRIEEKKRLQREIAKLEADYEINITPTYEEGGRGNQVTSKVENKILRKDNKIQEKEIRIKEIDAEIEALDYNLNQVNIRLGYLKRLEKEIITARYIDGESYEYIGNITYYNIKQQTRGERTIKDMIQKILEKLAKI